MNNTGQWLKFKELIDEGLIGKNEFVEKYLGDFSELDTIMDVQSGKQDILPTQADLVMHRLMEDCEYIAIAKKIDDHFSIVNVCKKCGYESPIPLYVSPQQPEESTLSFTYSES